MTHKTYRPVPISDLLESRSNSLSDIAVRVSRIKECQSTLRSLLGAPLSDHLYVANFSSNTLTLHTDSPAWASRLRFNIQTILNVAILNCGLKELKSVRIKVVVQNYDTSPARRPLYLSEMTASLIKNTADSINDRKLQTSLFNLSKHRD